MKPIIISTGISTFEDIKLAVETCRDVGNNDVVLLKCTSSYPAPLDEANMIMISDLAKKFDVMVGLSDHTLGLVAPITSIALGAKIIEKHFILDKSVGGPDASFSMDKNEFSEMVKSIRQAEMSLGNVDYSLTEKQEKSRVFSRSLFAVKDIEAGEKITKENIRSIRPGYGLHPKYFNRILDTKLSKKIKKGSPLDKSYLDIKLD